MPTRSVGTTVSSLCRKGFRVHNTHHRKLIYFTTDGRKSCVWTKVSHSKQKKQIPAGLLGQMAQQCRLSTEQFCDLVDCDLDQLSYEAILVEQGLVSRMDG